MGIRAIHGSTALLLAVSATTSAAGGGKSPPHATDIGYQLVVSFPSSAGVKHEGYGSTAALTAPVTLANGLVAMLGTNFGGGYAERKGAGYDTGTVFAFFPSTRTLSALYEFSQADGTGPTTGLVPYNGNWYGLTLGGGTNLLGTSYQISTTDGTEAGTTFQSLHSFGSSGTDAQQPARGRLVSDGRGNFYGVTTRGGANQLGTLFKMQVSGAVTILHEFAGGTQDGALPMDQPILDPTGNFLYGTTSCGGIDGSTTTAGCGGTVYKISTSGALAWLHAFSTPGGGYQPLASPVLVPASGLLVGTTSAGGAGYGVVYKLNAADGGGYSDFYHFAGTDGAFPVGRLLLASDALLYGTTSLGGAISRLFPKGDGTIFKVNAAAGTLTSLYSFGALANDLAHPMAGLVQDTNGVVWGTADNGGDGFGGGIFSFQPSGAVAHGRSSRGSRRRPGRAGFASTLERPPRSRRLTRACGKAIGLALAVLAGGARAQANVDMLEISKAWHLVVADFNGDGHDDLFVEGHDPDDRIWYWTPTGYQPGTFVFDVVDRHACDAADVNNDGMLDLFCMVGDEKGKGDTKVNELWIQGPIGVFTKVTGVGLDDTLGRGRIPLFIDVDNDGYPDIYATNEHSDPHPDASINRYYRNDQHGRFDEQFTAATGEFGYDCVDKGDIDKDGWKDMIVCQHPGNGHIFRNTHDSLFSEVAHGVAGSWIDAKLVDINGDGYDDLVVLVAEADQSNHLQVWLNDKSTNHFVGQATYDYAFPVLAGSPESLTVGDFNSDSWKKDIYVVVSRVCTDENLVVSTPDSPDVLFTQTSNTTWSVTALNQPSFYGCGRLAAKVDKSKVLLSNGTEKLPGPSYVLDFGN